ncbi:MAG: ribosome biogenesis GTPase Der [Acidobacteriota bacterium]
MSIEEVEPNETDASLPCHGTVAIVGRPNVGKSTLFNRLTRTRKAIVDSKPGITRDRIEGLAEWQGRTVRLVDTGGIELDEPDALEQQVVDQANRALAGAQLALLAVDVRAGLQPSEHELADLLRRTDLPVIVVVNKVDHEGLEAELAEFHALGFDHVLPIAAESGSGVAELLDEIFEQLPEGESSDDDDGLLRVAIIGRPNVGKSSLVNVLSGEERVVVSAVPGTTRDAVDVRLKVGEREMLLVDTAGLRRRGSDSERVEHVARVKAEQAVGRCDVAVLLLDAHEGPTHGDAVIAGLAADAGAGLVIAANKWDLVEEKEERFKTLMLDIRDSLRAASWAPVITISVHERERLLRLFETVAEVAERRHRRIPTSRLNEIVQDALRRHEPPATKGRPFRVKYLTQVATGPPTFVAFTTGGAPHFSWQRHLENRLRESLDLEGTPLVVRYRKGSSTRQPA